MGRPDQARHAVPGTQPILSSRPGEWPRGQQPLPHQHSHPSADQLATNRARSRNRSQAPAAHTECGGIVITYFPRWRGSYPSGSSVSWDCSTGHPVYKIGVRAAPPPVAERGQRQPRRAQEILAATGQNTPRAWSL